MRPTIGFLLALPSGVLLSGGVCVSCAAASAEPPARWLPAVAGAEAPGLPPLPRISPRNASYTIDARLDPERHTITGSLILDWRNTSAQPLTSFPFHLYWNAFRNDLSTSAREAPRYWTGDAGRSAHRFGWIQVKTVRLERSPATGAGAAVSSAAAGAEDLTSTLVYLHEDGNADDRTVMEVRTATPVPPGASVRFEIAWEALEPHGSVGRAGWVHDYNFVAQWFPKIGVFRDGAWGCHPFHAWTEFFSDFGVYDVRLHLPRGFVVGATGRLQERHTSPDGTESFRFVQEDVHDFAWTASRRFLERSARFDEPGYPRVEIRLLLQPEHTHLAARYLEATQIALRSFGTWSAPYPYSQITVVDPAWGSHSGGMEYPTLFTGGTSILAPRALQSPEGVTVHEAGHQFWYGLVANDETDEAWLDEGFNTYLTAKALDDALGPRAWGRRFFTDEGPRSRLGWPFVAPGVVIPRGSDSLADLRSGGSRDVMAKRGWTYRDHASYRLNSYGKPALVLQTLEGLLGEPTMLEVLRSYARRYRFAHPTTADFIATVNAVTGRDWSWFFAETFFSSELCDYAVEVENQPARGPGGFRSRVTVVRKGGVRLPVELAVELADGRRVAEHWDGQDRWGRFEYQGARVLRAAVDPERKIAIDVDPVNNEWVASDAAARRAATKWAARFLLWLQTFLELQTTVS